MVSAHGPNRDARDWGVVVDGGSATPWVATGYVAGPSLTQAVAAHGPLPAPTVRALGAGLAEALGAVHALGLVHRDVKPSNVLLPLEGPRLIDFGIARATDGTASLTSTGVSVGSPGYMAPEQILGKGVTGAADVFSLGAVLAYATAGVGPFTGDSSAALLYQVVHGEPELGALNGGLKDLVAHCLAKDPGARPAPAEIAARLAPGGAAPLMDAGWLPDPLVREVGRAAVRILDLETAAPVRDTSGPQPVYWPAPPGPDTHPPTAGSAGSAPPLGEFGAPTYDDARGGPDPRMSLSVTAGPDGPRRRKVSCTVVLAVAGALAAVMLGGVLLFDQLRTSGLSDRKDSAGGAPSASAPSASDPGDTDPGTPTPGSPAPGTSEPGDSATGAPAAVPQGFVGTWTGPTTTEDGLPHGDYTVEISAGGKGDPVLRSTSSLSLLGVEAECHGVGTLVSATTKEIRIEESTDPERPGDEGLCTTTEDAPLTFALTDGGELRFTSREEAAGNPRGTLTKR